MPLTDVHHPARVLLIEDSLDDERLALRALRGCEGTLSVRVARDGLLARRLMGLDEEPGASEREAPDLVISDLKMPGLDGRELLCLVRESPCLRHVPYVLFSSSNDLEDVRRCLGCGADAFVQKPVDYGDYLDCLRRVVPWALAGFCDGDRPPCVVAVPEPCGCGRRAA